MGSTDAAAPTPPHAPAHPAALVVAPVAVGVAALLLPVGPAAAVAAAVALGSLFLRQLPRSRERAGILALVAGGVAAAAVREAAASRLELPFALGSIEHVLPLLMGGFVLAAVWQSVGFAADRTAARAVRGRAAGAEGGTGDDVLEDVDEFDPSGPRWPTTRSSQWVRDAGLAAGAVVFAALWEITPALALLALLPILAGDRVVETRSSRWGAPIDRITGLPTASALRATLDEETARARRFGRATALLIIDLDGLSKINVAYGTEGGDAVLRGVANRLRSLARSYDVLARLSGGSFALVAPEVDDHGAGALADRVRAAVADAPFEVPTSEQPVPVTASVGLAVYPDDCQEVPELLVEAELAASYAKLQGGDRVLLAGRLPQELRGATRQVVSRSADAPGSPRAHLTAAPEHPPHRGPEAVRSTGSEPRPAGGVSAAPNGHRGAEATVARGVNVDAPERLVKVAPEPLAHAKPGTDRLLGTVSFLALAATGAALVFGPRPSEWAVVLLFAGLAVGAEWFSESVYGRTASSWSAVPLLGLALVTASPVEAAVGAATAAAVGGLLRANRGRQMAFNVAVLTLSALAADGVATVLAMVPFEATNSLGEAVVVGLLAGAAFFLVDIWLIATAVALTARSSVLEVWREDLLWLVPHQLGMGVLGGAAALAYVVIGAEGVLLLTIPAIGLHLAQRQFVNRTRDHVVRLRQLNDDLQYANTHVVRVNERLTEALEQVNEGYLVTVESLAAAVDARDSYTGSHIDRVEAYGRLILGVVDPELTDDEQLVWGFRLHDVGKIGVPDNVLLKPGPLTDEEWVLMRRHPEIGAGIIAAAPFLQGAKDIVLSHHERWDGRGYPFGLTGSNIPFGARLFSLADAYDAMTSNRPYRRAMSPEQALEELLRNSGTQFDPEMIEAMLQVERDKLIAVPGMIAEQRGSSRWRSRSGGLLIPIAENLVGEAEEESIVARRAAAR